MPSPPVLATSWSYSTHAASRCWAEVLPRVATMSRFLRVCSIETKSLACTL